ncbi:3-oxoacyl-[acyl-carrier-protein] synthase II [Streptomyces sp. V4I23]|uniref:beta-ketoacyl-[acyl-carrier-protein] synthase family protein n=1 Tax=Streptomyces sp. V4I23 TaxID=3042282 RepID=UPI0027840A47|nr:beta-ketoacyl-[acyl-carrier-protein] synthase family protein [Streptomyces sp. V4I23]MDQ1005907.1 3-oxoacyl-[acyl-carrier-protein] synthase II [Streptomyces sp. V4I23]
MSQEWAAVTGMGMVTPGGIGNEPTWRAVSAGISTGAVDPNLSGLPVDISCTVPGFDPLELLGEGPSHRLDRYEQFALVAAREALLDAGLDPDVWNGSRVGVVIGTGAAGVSTFAAQARRFEAKGAKAVSPYFMPMFLPNMPAAQLALAFGAKGPSLGVATACAAGATAIGIARTLLLAGACDVVLAGGAEAAITPLYVSAFARMGALAQRTDPPDQMARPFDAERQGMVLGEAGAVLVLERPEHAQRRKARVLARITGFGASTDAHHVTAPDPEGAGAVAAIQMALADADAHPQNVDHINAHGTSTVLNDLTEAIAIRKAVGDHPAVTSVKGVLGHCLGAAGAVEAACTVLSIRDGIVPPTANLRRIDPRVGLDVVSGAPRQQQIKLALSQSFGFGGQNAVLAIAAP